MASSKKRRIAGPPRSSYSPLEARSETVSTPSTEGSPTEEVASPPDRGRGDGFAVVVVGAGASLRVVAAAASPPPLAWPQAGDISASICD